MFRMTDEIFNNVYWKMIQKISFMQRVILIHSYLYYQLDNSVISDKEFDDACKQYLTLVENANSIDLMYTDYFYAFKDFDGNTGFDLIYKLNKEDRNKIQTIANQIIRLKNGSIK